MAVAVDIVIRDDSTSPQPISGAAVNVYDADGVLQGNATTDVNGVAAFLLPGAASPGGVAYEVRVFKLGVIFSNPTQILVFEPVPQGESNTFDLSGTLLSIPTSLDPRLCKCTGRFMDFANQPMAGVSVRITSKLDLGPGLQVPKIVDGNLISASGMAFETDSEGFLSVDLLRTGEYYVMFAGEDEYNWNIKVPDRSSVNLIDLMFPQPVSLSWDSDVAPGNAITLHVNDLVTVPFSALFSDYEVNPESIGKWLFFDQDTTLVANVGFDQVTGQITLKALAPGVLNVTPKLYSNLAPARVPDYALSTSPLVVTVVS